MVKISSVIEVKILNEPIDTAACIAAATDPECGGLGIFIGTIRNGTGKKAVVRLEYECYEPMAIKEMKKIADDVIHSWNNKNIVIHHRVGVLNIGDVAVVIAVSAPHREAALNGCRYAIDTLKKTVPVWKKEVFEDGEEWVAAHA